MLKTISFIGGGCNVYYGTTFLSNVLTNKPYTYSTLYIFSVTLFNIGAIGIFI